MRAWRASGASGRLLVVGSSSRVQRDQYEVSGYGAAHRGGAEESERLLQARPRGHGRGVADRAQRMAENGEALRYIELVLRQLRRASRDHRRLVQQRHADFRIGSSLRYEEGEQRARWRDRGRRAGSPSAGTWSRASSAGRPWESGEEVVAGRRSSERADVTTRLLTKRRDYGGTAQSIAGILAGPAQDGITAHQDLSYAPEDVGWGRSTREEETFGAWSLPETPTSSKGGTTSSTLV